MKVVIDIDDNLYTRLFDSGEDYVADMRRACVAIRKGTPLPKGHGDLKDVDRIFNEGFPKADINAEYEENMKKYPLWRTGITGIQTILKNAPTIIEAESEVKE